MKRTASNDRSGFFGSWPKLAVAAIAVVAAVGVTAVNVTRPDDQTNTVMDTSPEEPMADDDSPPNTAAQPTAQAEAPSTTAAPSTTTPPTSSPSSAEVMLFDDGLGPVTFGDSQDRTIAALEPLLGTAESVTTSQATWDGITLVFLENVNDRSQLINEFDSWEVDGTGQSAKFETPEGLRVGMTLGDAQQLYPGQVDYSAADPDGDLPTTRGSAAIANTGNFDGYCAYFSQDSTGDTSDVVVGLSSGYSAC